MFATCFLDVFHCFSSLNMLKQTRSEGLPLGSPRLGRLANAVKAACVMTGSGSTWKVSTCPSMVQSLKNLPDFFRQLQGTSNFTFCFYLLVLAAGCFHLFPSASGTVVLTLARLLSFRRMACKQRVTTRRVPTEPCRAMQGKPGFIAMLTNAIWCGYVSEVGRSKKSVLKISDCPSQIWNVMFSLCLYLWSHLHQVYQLPGIQLHRTFFVQCRAFSGQSKGTHGLIVLILRWFQVETWNSSWLPAKGDFKYTIPINSHVWPGSGSIWKAGVVHSWRHKASIWPFRLSTSELNKHCEHVVPRHCACPKTPPQRFGTIPRAEG